MCVNAYGEANMTIYITHFKFIDQTTHRIIQHVHCEKPHTDPTNSINVYIYTASCSKKHHKIKHEEAYNFSADQMK